jgi:hypothetical protein
VTGVLIKRENVTDMLIGEYLMNMKTENRVVQQKPRKHQDCQ